MPSLLVKHFKLRRIGLVWLTWAASVVTGFAQESPYDEFPEAEAPYFRIRYEASSDPGELQFAVNYTVWIPPEVTTLRGVVVHQHGCGVGSCRSGLTGAFDLHWQALARKHHCALLAPAYEQPEGADCQLWCDPRNGSSDRFQRALRDLGMQSGHPELASVPWALWGHSGGGHWAGGMLMLHPDRIAAAWLRSGVPLLTRNPERPDIKHHQLPDAALTVPVMCNLGTKEGFSETTGRFSGVWPANEVFFESVRSKGGLICIAVDPLTSHECGNQRYLAIPWFDGCLSRRLPDSPDQPLRSMPTENVWLANYHDKTVAKESAADSDSMTHGWLFSKEIAEAWQQYVMDTEVADDSPPPAPLAVQNLGGKLTWTALADLQSGLAGFVIKRDGVEIARLPAEGSNRFGRPVFQGLLYSDTPTFPLERMEYIDPDSKETSKYEVLSINTRGAQSKPAPEGS